MSGAEVQEIIWTIFGAAVAFTIFLAMLGVFDRD
jgi:hypothetical protein